MYHQLNFLYIFLTKLMKNLLFFLQAKNNFSWIFIWPYSFLKNGSKWKTHKCQTISRRFTISPNFTDFPTSNDCPYRNATFDNDTVPFHTKFNGFLVNSQIFIWHVLEKSTTESDFKIFNRIFLPLNISFKSTFKHLKTYAN